MERRTRMSSEERKKAILRAVLPVFARKGFLGATSKELAAAAGVSEALLYKYFPTKEALYAAIGALHFNEEEARPEVVALLQSPPATQRLILMVEYFIRHIAHSESDLFARLMIQSLFGDGTFARTTLSRVEPAMIHLFRGSLLAAREAGDLVTGVPEGELAIWFVHHLAFAMKLLALPSPAAVDYGWPKSQVFDEAVKFALRGLGLTPEAISRYFQSENRE